MNKAQTAFINDRFILDSVVMAQEIMTNCHYHKQNGVLMKLDFEKAMIKLMGIS